MSKKKSKYERRLRELGCMPYTELLTKKDIEETDSFAEMINNRPIFWKSQKERKRLVAQKLLPSLLVLGNNLFILDETGTDWTGPLTAKPDLLRLGFNDSDSDPRMTRRKSRETRH